MKKEIALVCSTVILLLCFVYPISACNDNGGYESIYGSTKWTLFGNKYTVTAEIDKCSCNPVNNYLKVFLRVQYYYNNTYYWEPETDGYFRTSDGTNVGNVNVSITESYPINYGLGVYYKTCNGVRYDTHLEYPDDAT